MADKNEMRRPYIPFFAFFVLLLVTIPLSFDYATSVVPGWHRTIFPPYFVWGAIVLVVLLLVTIGYWLLSKRVGKVSWTIFVIHFILTIPAVIFLRFPYIQLDLPGANQQELTKALSMQLRLISIAWTLFIVGQIFFSIYYIRIMKIKPVAR